MDQVTFTDQELNNLLTVINAINAHDHETLHIMDGSLDNIAEKITALPSFQGGDADPDFFNSKNKRL